MLPNPKQKDQCLQIKKQDRCLHIKSKKDWCLQIQKKYRFPRTQKKATRDVLFCTVGKLVTIKFWIRTN